MRMEPRRVAVTPGGELDRLLAEAGGAPLVLEQDGVRRAAIISVDDLERFNRIEAERAARFKVLDEIGEAFKDEDPARIEREVARAIDEVRAENRRAEERRAASGQ